MFEVSWHLSEVSSWAIYDPSSENLMGASSEKYQKVILKDGFQIVTGQFLIKLSRRRHLWNREGLPHFTLLWKIFTTRSLSLLLSEECLKSINANRVPFQLGMFLLLYPYVTWTLAKQIDFIWKHNWEKVWPTFDYGISHKKAGKIWSTF